MSHGVRFAARAPAEIDAGLRRHMPASTTTWPRACFSAALLRISSANTALGGVFYSGRAQLTVLGWIAVFAPLGLLLVASFAAHRLSATAIQSIYWGLTALMGVSLAAVLQVYTGQSITRTFFVTAAAFGGLSLWGYTTQRDLSGMGSFLLMGLIGILIAGLVNLFLASSALQFAISAIGVVIFAGLTAYDTQRLKEEYITDMDDGVATKLQVFGALSLYLNFVNLFQFLLSFIGERKA